MENSKDHRKERVSESKMVDEEQVDSNNLKPTSVINDVQRLSDSEKRRENIFEGLNDEEQTITEFLHSSMFSETSSLSTSIQLFKEYDIPTDVMKAVSKKFPTSFKGKYDHICKQCGKKIHFSESLLQSLVKEMCKEQLNYDGVKTFQCRVCDNEYRKRNDIAGHVLEHFKANEIYYCDKCQLAINIICFDSLPDPSYRNRFLIPSGESESLISSKKIPVKSAIYRVLPFSPKCGKCGRIFDYVRPLINKLLDANVRLLTSKEGRVKEAHCYICRLCPTWRDRLHSMQQHALKHIKRKQIMCRSCEELKSI